MQIDTQTYLVSCLRPCSTLNCVGDHRACRAYIWNFTTENNKQSVNSYDKGRGKINPVGGP